MERNDFPAGNRAQGSTGETGAGGVGGGLGNTGSTLGTQGYGSGANPTGTTGAEGAGFADRARDIAGTAQEKLADVGSTVRERAAGMKDSLADALESGADKLRQRVQSSQTGGSQLAGATTAGAVTTTDSGRVTVAGERLAGGMQATADWLRDADLDSLKTGVERQVKEHPGRTLLIAVGLGYLLGKAFRNR